MTRFKKELIKLGVDLEETLPYMPCNDYECIYVLSERASVVYYHIGLGRIENFYGRNMEIFKQDIED